VSAVILYWGIGLAQIMLGLAMVCCAWRLFFGPRAQDRIMGLDTLTVTSMMMLLLFGMRAETSLYFEAALIIALLGFVSSIALAKLLMRGEVIE